MAYGGPSNVRDNFGRFQKQATININKKLRKLADSVKENVEEDVANTLLETYKNNVLVSYLQYGNRGGKGEYEHTGTFIDAIDVKTEKDAGIGRDRIKIYLKPKVYEDDGHRGEDITVGQVYEWLTEGTEGGGSYWFQKEDGTRPSAYNYPTPIHDFELHTQLQMKGYLSSLKLKNFTKK